MKNYKVFTIIALVLMLALVVPTSAVWSNDKWIDSEHSDEYFGNAEVKYDSVTGVTSKYSDPTDVNLMTYQGHVYGNLKSGHVLEGGERFLVSNDLTPNMTKEYKFTADGLFDDYFAEGNYTITLPQGTGSAAGVYTEDIGWIGNLHGEVAHINVKAGQTTYFTFIGNSVPTWDSACVPKYTIIEASYCGEGSVVDTPAHTEYRVRGHWHYYWWFGVQHYYWDHSNSWSLWSDSTPDHFTDIPNNDKQTRGVQATYKDVSGCASGVKESLQVVVNGGHMSFLFDNAKNPGGIFSADGSKLLLAVTDPLSGIQKHVSITYNAGCGTSDKTIEAMEYEVINL